MNTSRLPFPSLLFLDINDKIVQAAAIHLRKKSNHRSPNQRENHHATDISPVPFLPLPLPLSLSRVHQDWAELRKASRREEGKENLLRRRTPLSIRRNAIEGNREGGLRG